MTDPAAGKRVLITEPYDGHPDSETCPGCPHAPAEPDAGAALTLTDKEYGTLHDAMSSAHPFVRTPMVVEHILVARLDAVRRKAGDERAEQIAQAIEAGIEDDYPLVSDCMRDAARIARESRS